MRKSILAVLLLAGALLANCKKGEGDKPAEGGSIRAGGAYCVADKYKAEKVCEGLLISADKKSARVIIKNTVFPKSIDANADGTFSFNFGSMNTTFTFSGNDTLKGSNGKSVVYQPDFKP